MADDSGSPTKPGKSNTTLRIFLVIFIGGLLLVWLLATPPGLLGKSDAIAYSVCHRISSHSYYFGDRPISLCARCSGQYLGFLWGFGLQAFLGKKRSGFPSRWVVGGLFLLFSIYALDGLNSLFTVYPGLNRYSLYQPANYLRLFSGLGMGLVISGFYYPLLGQTIWRDYKLESPLAGSMEWLVWIGGAILIGFLGLTGNPLILYPLILLSTGGLMALLTLLYMVIWIVLTRNENSFQSWGELRWWMVAGFGTALLQIALIDLIRFSITGTWSGFLVY